MDSIILLLVMAILIIYAIVTSYNGIVSFREKQGILFTYNMPAKQYDPFPTTVNVNNTRDCNANSLEVCNVRDSSTLFGCKELLVRCVHFDRDTIYETPDGTTTTIPKNKTQDEGYALAVENVNQACNMNHGDLVLVTESADSDAYMFICKCKYEGYIGNDNILGPCETVHICNGKIDSIDKPLNEIQCVCENHEQNVRYNELVPACKTLTILEANKKYQNWDHVLPSTNRDLMSTDNLVPTIQQNLNCSKVMNTCKYAFDNTDIRMTDSRLNDNRVCETKDAGIPVDLGIMNSTNKHQPSVSGVFHTETYQRLRLSGLNDKKFVAVTAKTKFPDENDSRYRVFALKEDITVGETMGQVQMTKTLKSTGRVGQCYRTGPTTYECVYKSAFTFNRQGFQLAQYPNCPYPWGETLWNTVHKWTSSGVELIYAMPSLQLTSHFHSIKNLKSIGYEISNGVIIPPYGSGDKDPQANDRKISGAFAFTEGRNRELFLKYFNLTPSVE